jgi:hypothetical protein
VTPTRSISTGPCRLLWILGAAVLAAFQLAAASARLELDRLFMESGETVPLKIIVEDAQPTAVPQIPAIPLVAGREYLGPEQRSQIINGVSSYQVVFKFRIQVRGTGELLIPSVVVPSNSGNLQTVPVRAHVLAAEEHTNGVSLHLYTARDTCYVGETIPYELQLQATMNLREASPPKMSFDGFVIGRSTPNLQSQIIRDGRVVGIMTTRQTATPTKEGDLLLGPASQEVVAEVGRRRPQSLLDDFFGGGAELQRGSIEAPARTIRVLPLPADGRPADYSGAIGRFTVEANVSRTNLSVGDAVTVRFVVSGRGSFDSLPSPRLLPADGLKAYPGTNSFEADDSLGLFGTKTFEEAVVVESAGIRSLQFEPFSFFDSETGRYTTARLRPIAITVKESAAGKSAAAAETKAPAAEPVRAPQPVADLQPLMPRPGGGAPLGPSWSGSPWFGAVILAPIVGLGLLAGVRGLRTRRAQANLPTRRALAQMSVRDQHASLRQAAATGNSRAFFDALSAVLRQQVALTLGLGSAASVTAGDVDEALASRGMSADSIGSLNRLFDATDAARFAPMALPDELATWLSMAESVLAELRSLEGGK